MFNKFHEFRGFNPKGFGAGHCGPTPFGDEDRHGRHERGIRGERGEGHERGGRHWQGGRGHGRPFEHGELRLVILALIAERPRHGYEIIKEIEDRFGGGYTPSPGVVYPTLTMLEELGSATVEEAGGKKLYSITEQGRATLAAEQAAADAAMARMQAIGARFGGGQSPQLLRAIQNFRFALSLRQRRGPLTEEQLRAIGAAIDAAAVAIEQS
jgi:DNA-binding PadR family transcriptional regulator